MHAIDALPIRRGDVASFVGGGGKTSLLYGCGEALARSGLRVLSTTTTRVETPSPDQCAVWLWDGDEDRLLNDLPSRFAESRHVAAGRRVRYPDRFEAVSDAFVSKAVASHVADVVLVEADGARHRHLKAPRNGEPVPPRATTIYVPVAGIDVMGKPLTDEFVHRAEIAAGLAEVPLGTVIDRRIFAAILLHPKGLLAAAPPGARIVPFLSFCESVEARASAREVAGEALRTRRCGIRRVVLGTAHDQQALEVVER